MLSSNPIDPQEVCRRNQLRTLDAILGDLELLNLREATNLPPSLSERLRRAGVGHPDGAAISEIIDLVFRAQEPYLTPMPSITTRRRSAA